MDIKGFIYMVIHIVYNGNIMWWLIWIISTNFKSYVRSIFRFTRIIFENVVNAQNYWDLTVLSESSIH